jgi:predicted ArsR family transcriptional regulator
MSMEDRAKRREEIAADLKEHGDIAATAQRFRVSDHQVRKCAAIFGVRGKVPRQTHATTIRIVAALINAPPGATLRSVADQLRIHKKKVQQIFAECHRAGIPLGQWTRPPELGCYSPQTKQ